MPLGKTAGNRGLAADREKHVASTEGIELARFDVFGGHPERLDGITVGDFLVPRDSKYLVGIAYNIVEVPCAPSEVVFVLDSRGQEGIQVGKVYQAALLVDVVEEGKVRPRVPKTGKILDEGYLHFGPGQEHASMPGKSCLLLQEKHLGCLRQRAGLQGVVEGDGNSKARRAKADTNQVVHFLGICRVEELAFCLGLGMRYCRGYVDSVEAVGTVHTVGAVYAVGGMDAVDAIDSVMMRAMAVGQWWFHFWRWGLCERNFLSRMDLAGWERRQPKLLRQKRWQALSMAKSGSQDAQSTDVSFPQRGAL